MKNLFLVLISLCLVTGLTAQTKVNKKDVQKATDEWVALYQLNADQAKEVYELQERRLINLSEIEKVKTSDYPLYLRKCRAVRIAAENSLKKILTDTQMTIYNDQLAERRKQEAAKMKELKRQGASKEEIELGLLEIQ